MPKSYENQLETLERSKLLTVRGCEPTQPIVSMEEYTPPTDNEFPSFNMNSGCMNTEWDFFYKIRVVGAQGSGKSCLVLRLADDTYTEAYIAICVDKLITYEANTAPKKVIKNLFV